jgi:hypothetical protein
MVGGGLRKDRKGGLFAKVSRVVLLFVCSFVCTLRYVTLSIQFLGAD